MESDAEDFYDCHDYQGTSLISSNLLILTEGLSIKRATLFLTNFYPASSLTNLGSPLLKNAMLLRKQINNWCNFNFKINVE